MNYTISDVMAQMQALPPAFSLWLNWLSVVVIMAPFVFSIWEKRARRLALLQFGMLLTQMPVLFVTGLSNLASLPHIVWWTPAVIYMAGLVHRREVSPTSIFGAWGVIMSVTAVTSMVFDVRDFSRFVAGDRAPVTPSVDAATPVLVLAIIAVCVVFLLRYMLKPRRA